MPGRLNYTSVSALTFNLKLLFDLRSLLSPVLEMEKIPAPARDSSPGSRNPVVEVVGEWRTPPSPNTYTSYSSWARMNSEANSIALGLSRRSKRYE